MHISTLGMTKCTKNAGHLAATRGIRVAMAAAARHSAADMEPKTVKSSTSGVFVRLHSRTGSASALMVLILQLLFTGLVPAADARALAADAGSRMGVHVEKPGVHHAVHDSGDCVFCVSMQLGAVPAPLGRAPEAGTDHRMPAPAETACSHCAVLLTCQVARAPPFAA